MVAVLDLDVGYIESEELLLYRDPIGGRRAVVAGGNTLEKRFLSSRLDVECAQNNGIGPQNYIAGILVSHGYPREQVNQVKAAEQGSEQRCRIGAQVTVRRKNRVWQEFRLSQ